MTMTPQNYQKALSQIKAIPKNQHQLDLDIGEQHFGLATPKIEQVQELLKAIPTHVTAINFNWDNLLHVTSKEFKSLMNKIPPHVNSVNFTDYPFFYVNPIFQEVTPTEIALINTLCKQHNDRDYQLTTCLDINDFLQIKDKLKNEKLAEKLSPPALIAKDKDNVNSLIDSIPKHVTQIAFGFSNFYQAWKYAPEKIPSIMTAISKRTNIFDLSAGQKSIVHTNIYNYEYRFVKDTLEATLKNVPEQLTGLALQHYGLGKDTEFFNNILETLRTHLPKQMTFLDLRHNTLNQLTAEQLTKLFVAIEPITSIDVGENNLNKEQLISLINNLPNNITTLVGFKDDFYGLPEEECHEVFTAIENKKINLASRCEDSFAFKIKKLDLLLADYEKHLQDVSQREEKSSSLQEKMKIAQLLKTQLHLNDVNEQPQLPSARIKAFQDCLNKNREILSEHRHRFDYYFKLFLSIVAIVPIFFYEKANGHSIGFFSQSHGGALVDEINTELNIPSKHI